MLIKNYFKTASRNLKKNKFFTLLNVFCLALGMSISLLFVALLSFVNRYDDFHANKDRIYRVTTHVKDNDENPEYASAPVALAQKLREDVTGVETVIPVHASLFGEAVYIEKQIPLYGYFAGPEFLKTFNFPLIKGNVASALSNPNSIVISELEATKIFGSKDPIGEVIRFEPYGDMVVTGVLKKLPKNSHMRFDALASYATLISQKGSSFMESEDGWRKFINSYVYVILSENSTASDVERFLNVIAKEKYRRQQNFSASFSLQPLNKIVPGPSLYNPIGGQWDFLSLTLVGLTTMIILIPACANYVNLSISQSLQRMKEIGVRKVMGGQRKQIFSQFVMETIITMFLALVLSYFMFEAIRNEFLQTVGSAETMDLSPTTTTVIYFVLFALFVGVAAGVTPALYFSKINPLNALKGKPEKTTRGIRFPIRKVIITVQFMLSLGFITSVAIMFRQYRYSVNYDLGFEQENILDVQLKNVDQKIFRNEYARLASVERISMSSHILGLEYNSGKYVKDIDLRDSVESAAIAIDENFFSNMNLSLIAGKSFSDNAALNAQFVIVNEELVKKLKINDTHAAIDKLVVLPNSKGIRIGGVVKNFHYTGLNEPIGCLYFEYDPAQFKYANVKLTSKNSVQDIASMEALWKKIGGSDKFTWRYFSDEIAEGYSFYFEIIKIWGYLGLLAITVACLGLLGTVVFTIRNRVKEVSIRKVVGASSQSLVILLSKDFVMLMIIASVITLPVTYIAFADWLLPSMQHYRGEIGFLEMMISVVIMSTLGLTTVLSQTLKAANMNPVDNLRVE
jgi:putative ABC transport system permease protein